MKIIDEKGQLFGWINIIDFLAIIFILSLAPMVWFGYKLFTAQPIQPSQPIPVFYSEKQYQDLQQQYQELKDSGVAAVTTYQMQIAKLNAEVTKLNDSINNFIKEHKKARKYFGN